MHDNHKESWRHYRIKQELVEFRGIAGAKKLER